MMRLFPLIISSLALASACGSPTPTHQANAGSPENKPPATNSAAAPADGTSTPAPPSTGDPPAHEGMLARSGALERAGDTAGAIAVANEAVIAGGGRDAQLQVAKLAIIRNELARARTALGTILTKTPNDGAALYNLGLVEHRSKPPNYNAARKNYLAAINALPDFSAARYNLVVLCTEHRVFDEAEHHLAEFQKTWPTDERGARLRARIEAAKAAPTPG